MFASRLLVTTSARRKLATSSKSLVYSQQHKSLTLPSTTTTVSTYQRMLSLKPSKGRLFSVGRGSREGALIPPLMNPKIFISNSPTMMGRTRTSSMGTISRRSIYTKRRQIKGGDGLRAKPVPVESTRQSLWLRLIYYLKLARIPSILVAIYGLGYQKGIMDTVRNPQMLQLGIFNTICIQMGVESEDDIDIISQRKKPQKSHHHWILPSSSTSSRYTLEKEHKPETVRVARIGRDIITASRLYVHEHLHIAVEKAKEKLQPLNLDREALLQKVTEDDDVQTWVKARQRLEGEAMDTGIDDWQFILVGTPVPNAFVSESLPQRFFVTTALFEHFVRNDDELAMILGHEISHLILGHLSESNVIEYILLGLELVILMIDPTEGILSLGILSFLASTRTALLAAFSRSHETEADELGCKIAAMACFDTVKGSEVFRRMHEYEISQARSNGANSSSQGNSNNIMSTHPPSQQRYEELKEISMNGKENYTKYSYCNRMQDRIRKAFSISRRS